MGVIRIGRFDHFAGDDTLLIEADRLGFMSLIGSIEQLQIARGLVALHELPGAVAYGGVTCTLELTSEDRGLVAHGPRDFTWCRSVGG